MELTAAEPRRKHLTQLYLDGEPGPKIDTEVFLLSRLKPRGRPGGKRSCGLWWRNRTPAGPGRRPLYLLEHRSHSKRELTEKVARTAASREAAQAAADRLKSGAFERQGLCRKLCPGADPAQALWPAAGEAGTGPQGHPRDMAEEVLAPYGEEDSAGENIRLVLSKRYACGGRTKRSGAGPWPPCSGWATLMSRCARLWAGWIRNKGEAGRQSGFFFVRMGKSLG